MLFAEDDFVSIAPNVPANIAMNTNSIVERVSHANTILSVKSHSNWEILICGKCFCHNGHRRGHSKIRCMRDSKLFMENEQVMSTDIWSTLMLKMGFSWKSITSSTPNPHLKSRREKTWSNGLPEFSRYLVGGSQWILKHQMVGKLASVMDCE